MAEAAEPTQKPPAPHAGARPDAAPVRVSYVLSTRNRAAFLDQALQNVREFITPEDELIFIDGASTDGTAEVAARHADIVSVFRSERDFGEAHGLNKGVLLARGRYVKPLSDDDYYYPDAMCAAIAALETHPQVDALLAGGEAWMVNPATGERSFRSYVRLPSGERMTSHCGSMPYVHCGLGLLLRRSVFSRIGLFDTSFVCVDTDYLHRLMDGRVSFRYLDVKLYRHVRYAHSGSQREGELYPERVRVVQRRAAWPELMEMYWANPAAVSQSLGLGTIPAGPWLLRLVWYGEQCRRHAWLRPLLYALGLPVLALDAGIQTLRRCRHWVRRLGGSPPTPTGTAPPEPPWDKRLR